MVSVHIYQREANKGKKKGKKSFQKGTLINADNVLFNVKEKKKRLRLRVHAAFLIVSIVLR